MNVDELREELKSAAAQNAALDDARPAIHQRAVRLRKNRRRMLSAIVAGSLAAVIAAGIFAFRSDDPRTVRIRPARPTTNPTTTTSPSTLTTPTAAPTVAQLAELGGTSDPGLPAGWLRCTNQAGGFSIGAPGDWYTATEGPYQASPGFDGACSFFDPGPFTVDADVTPQAIQLRFPLGDAFPAQPFATAVQRYAASASQINEQRDTNVAGNPAVYLDFIAGDGVAKGRNYVCYIVNDDRTAFTICTVDAPERTALTFEQRRAALDQAVATLKLFAPTQSTATPACTLEQLHATFGFLAGANTALGSVILTNTSKAPCNLAGRPDDVELVNDQGQLPVAQRPGGRAPNGDQPPASPILLEPDGASEAGVLLEWNNWCGQAPGTLHVEVHFTGWRASLNATPTAGADPTVTPRCADSSASSELTVDYVRVHDSTGFH
jgi:Domain of unknown function (DUF4232)